MPITLIAQLLIGVAFLALSYILAPKPRGPRRPSVTDLQDPTAEAGRPVMVIFGSIEVRGLNILYSGQKDINVREIDAGGGKK